MSHPSYSSLIYQADAYRVYPLGRLFAVLDAHGIVVATYLDQDDACDYADRAAAAARLMTRPAYGRVPFSSSR